jgi:adenine-specific DNA-methyltransferase
VTIDEKEYLRLGLLLEQVFPESDIQMVTSVINPKGSARSGRFSRVDEYLFFVMVGSSHVQPWVSDMLRPVSLTQRKVRWAGLMRQGEGSRRERIPSMFFPIYIDAESGAFHSAGEPPLLELEPSKVEGPPGTVALWPVDGSGRDMMWRLNPASVREYVDAGHLKFGRRDPETGARPAFYLQQGVLDGIASGAISVVGHDSEGAVMVEFADSLGTRKPTTTWNMTSHSASEHGSSILKSLIPGRRFPYPKSVYAVEDALRFFVGDNPDAVILDFFAGSGTTAHAVMRLNRQDGGRRQCILVTNNEVSADEEKALRDEGLQPGDPAWEALGICEHITKPRIAAAITGQTPEGAEVDGDYKFVDEFPMSEGFGANAEFFDLTYEDPERVRFGLGFDAIAPLLWLSAGAQGSRISADNSTYATADAHAVLFGLDAVAEFVEAVRNEPTLRSAFIVTDDEGQFQIVAGQLPHGVQSMRLYGAYLDAFRIQAGA